jgi:hypothetical protein
MTRAWPRKIPMSDANVLVARREPELSEQDEAGIITAAVELGVMHSYEEAMRVIHALTIRLAEKDETIAALNALAAKLEALVAALGGRKPELRVVREEAIQIPEWAEVKR